jgi:hypothetical protein
MKKYFLIMLWLLVIGVSGGAAHAQAEEKLIRVVSVTAQGIAFYEPRADGLHLLGSLPENIALQSLGGQAEWLIRGKSGLALSGDGQQIAFTARRGEEAALFIYTFGEEQLIQRSLPSYWLFPQWSPDSQAVLLHAPLPFLEPVSVPENFIYNLAADTFIPVTSGNSIERDFNWTDDSQGVVYLGGCEFSACADRHRADYYGVSRDGSERHALTDIATQISDIDRPYFCQLIWSAGNQRWYYEVGCATGSDEGAGKDRIYSVSRDGDNRLEIDLEAYFKTLYPQGSLDWMDVKSIQATANGVYLGLQMAFDTGTPPYANNQLIQWRVLQVDFSGNITTAYQPAPPLPDGGVDNQVGYGRTLDSSVVSPDQRHVAMIVGTLAQVFDLDTDVLVAEANAEGIICDALWLDDQRIIYNQSLSQCDSVDVVVDDVKVLDIADGSITTLNEDLDSPSWMLLASG